MFTNSSFFYICLLLFNSRNFWTNFVLVKIPPNFWFKHFQVLEPSVLVTFQPYHVPTANRWPGLAKESLSKQTEILQCPQHLLTGLEKQVFTTYWLVWQILGRGQNKTSTHLCRSLYRRDFYPIVPISNSVLLFVYV